MKSLLLTLALVFGASTVSAQDFKYLTLQEKSGAETSLSLEGLKLTFNEGNLVATNKSKNVSVSLEKLAKMFFADTNTTGIEDAAQAVSEINVKIVNGKLYVSAPEGSKVRVYNVEGRQMPTSNLKAGVYLVRVNNQTFKVLSK